MKYRLSVAILTVIILLLACLLIKLTSHGEKENRPDTQHIDNKSEEKLSIPDTKGLEVQNSSEVQSKNEDMNNKIVAINDGITWITLEKTTQAHFYTIPKNIIRKNTDSFKKKEIKTKTEAFEHLSKSISMALAPRIAFEDDKYYYFSGGMTAYHVDDFSIGLGVSKATGEIISWRDSEGPKVN